METITPSLRIITIEKYLEELEKKYTTNEKKVCYSYGIRPNDMLVIYKITNNDEDTKKEVYIGPLHETDQYDNYYVDFPKSNVKILIYFFM